MVPNKHEYLFIECTECEKKVKMAKNKGNYWKAWAGFLEEFLQEHNTCSVDFIKLRWEK